MLAWDSRHKGWLQLMNVESMRLANQWISLAAVSALSFFQCFGAVVSWTGICPIKKACWNYHHRFSLGEPTARKHKLSVSIVLFRGDFVCAECNWVWRRHRGVVWTSAHHMKLLWLCFFNSCCCEQLLCIWLPVFLHYFALPYCEVSSVANMYILKTSFLCVYILLVPLAFKALTLLFRCQEEHTACKMIEWWGDYLSIANDLRIVRWGGSGVSWTIPYGPADATATPLSLTSLKFRPI